MPFRSRARMRPPSRSASVALVTYDFSSLSAGAAALPVDLSLTRASAATVQTGTSTVVTSGIGVDQARAGRRLDADPLALVIEEARTNTLLNSRNTPLWAGGGSGTTETRPDGTAPDGSSTTATRTQGTGFGRYTQFAAETGPIYTGSFWQQQGAGGAASARRQFGTANVDYTTAVAWSRVVTTYTTVGAIFFLTPINSLPAGQDVRHDLHQVELGQFATEAIVTTSGTATRAGERLTCSSDLRDAGRVSLAITLQPKGASTQYASDMTLWYLDASNNAVINTSDRKVKITVGGVAYTAAVAMSWSANDVLDIYVAAGGSIASEASYRVNAGAKTTLSTGTPTTFGALGAGSLDLLCAGTSNQFTAWVRSITAYRSGRRPSWA